MAKTFDIPYHMFKYLANNSNEKDIKLTNEDKRKLNISPNCIIKKAYRNGDYITIELEEKEK